MINYKRNYILLPVRSNTGKDGIEIFKSGVRIPQGIKSKNAYNR